MKEKKVKIPMSYAEEMESISSGSMKAKKKKSIKRGERKKKVWLFKCLGCDVVFSVLYKYKSCERHWCPVCKAYKDVEDAL